MKEFITIVLLFASGTSYSDDWRDVCAEFSKMSGKIMELRQKGALMHDVIDVMGGDKILEHFVELAYSQSRYSTDSVQNIVIEEFSNSAYRWCAKSLKNN